MKEVYLCHQYWQKIENANEKSFSQFDKIFPNFNTNYA